MPTRPTNPGPLPRNAIAAASPLRPAHAPRRASTATIAMAAPASAIPLNPVPAPKDVAFEPEALPAVTVAQGDALAFEGDLLVVAVAEEDIEVKGE